LTTANHREIPMANYVDAFVIPLPRKKIAAYRKMAALGCKVWMDHGALDYKECVGEDLKASFAMAFPRGIRTRPGETVVFSWILYKSRAHRDRVNAKVMKDPRMQPAMVPKEMPFDVKRMLYGGFEVIVAA
jgi:uncharacterized protein YbaA (DUF1428 family)